MRVINKIIKETNVTPVEFNIITIEDEPVSENIINIKETTHVVSVHNANQTIKGK